MFGPSPRAILFFPILEFVLSHSRNQFERDLELSPRPFTGVVVRPLSQIFSHHDSIPSRQPTNRARQFDWKSEKVLLRRLLDIHTTMSNVYATEPEPTGRVVFQTTHGPIDVQLWCRECPDTTKLFMQLCMDGFYDDMIFHRIMDTFLIQTGAIRLKGQPQAFDKEYRQKVEADVALDRRRYEAHSRLRFNHRGQLAMALEVDKKDDTDSRSNGNGDAEMSLQPQFFITLDEAPYLDSKHVLFGTIRGPTIYNALRIGKLEVDESNPDYAPRIKSVKIVENPIHKDLVPHPSPPWKDDANPNGEDGEDRKEKKKQKKKKNRKGKKDLNVLSFGDEVEDEAVIESGIRSSHDVVSSMKKEVDDEVQEAAQREAGRSSDGRKEKRKSKSERHKSKRSTESRTQGSTSEKADADGGSVRESPAETNVASKRSREGNKQRSKAQEARESHREGSGRVRNAVSESEETAVGPPKTKKPKLSAIEARRAKYTSRSKQSKTEREDKTMARLFSFQSKVRQQVSDSKATDRKSGQDDSLAARMMRKADKSSRFQGGADETTETYHGQVLERDDSDDADVGDWMTTKFKCKRHIDHASRMEEQRGGDGRSVDDYAIVQDHDSKSHRNKGRNNPKSDRHERRRRRRHDR